MLEKRNSESDSASSSWSARSIDGSLTEDDRSPIRSPSPSAHSGDGLLAIDNNNSNPTSAIKKTISPPYNQFHHQFNNKFNNSSSSSSKTVGIATLESVTSPNSQLKAADIESRKSANKAKTEETMFHKRTIQQMMAIDSNTNKNEFGTSLDNKKTCSFDLMNTTATIATTSTGNVDYSTLTSSSLSMDNHNGMLIN